MLRARVLHVTRDEAIEAVRVGGRSTRDVARDAGVSHVTIARWVKAAEAAEAAGAAGAEKAPRRAPRKPRKPAAPPAQPAPGAPAISARAAALAARMRAPEPDDELDEPEEPEGDTLATLRSMLRRTLRLARESQAVGNHTAAQRAMRDAGGLTNTIARLERVAAQESDVLRISRAQIDEAIAGVYARVATLLDRPLHCAKCARELSVEWGTAGTNRATGKA